MFCDELRVGDVFSVQSNTHLYVPKNSVGKLFTVISIYVSEQSSFMTYMNVDIIEHPGVLELNSVAHVDVISRL